MIPTAHIQVADKKQIAKTVLMPGDPLRAKYVAENFLTDAVQINATRNMFGYTGSYKGRKVSIMGSGMGMGSIGIYSYELFKFYDVDNIIRVGSAGAYTEELKNYDIILATDAWSESTYAQCQSGYTDPVVKPSPVLLEKLKNSAKKLNLPVVEGRIHSSDVFYRENHEVYHDIYRQHGCLCVEMEAFALFHNANITGKSAAALLTISDMLPTHEHTTAEEREKKFDDMLNIALNID